MRVSHPTKGLLTETTLEPPFLESTRFRVCSRILARVSDRCSMEAFRLSRMRLAGRGDSRLRRISATVEGGSAGFAETVRQLEVDGQVTALGSVLDQLIERVAGQVSAVVVISDFAQNSGASPTSGDRLASLEAADVPFFTLGMGREQLRDLAVELEVPTTIRSGHPAPLSVRLRSTDLRGRSVEVHVQARLLRDTGSTVIDVDKRRVMLTGENQRIPLMFSAPQTGLWEFSATASSVAGELSLQNNRAAATATAIDDYLRMLYVADQPSWEWRFVKEAFHRDELVGIGGVSDLSRFIGSPCPGARTRCSSRHSRTLGKSSFSTTSSCLTMIPLSC